MARCEARLIDPFTNGHGLGERLKHFMRFCRSRVLPPSSNTSSFQAAALGLAWPGEGALKAKHQGGCLSACPSSLASCGGRCAVYQPAA